MKTENICMLWAFALLALLQFKGAGAYPINLQIDDLPQ